MAIIPYGSSTLTNTYTATLTTNWTEGGTGWYTQVVTVDGILSTDNPVIDVATTTSNYKNEQGSWAKVFKAETADNQITFYASSSTDVNITLNIKVVR